MMISRRTFLFSTSGLAAAMLLPASLNAKSLLNTTFHAGSGRAWVTFPETSWPLDGFTGQHDSLGVRFVLMDDGHRRTAVAVIDITSISDAMISHMKAIITELTHTPDSNILVYASHTFSAPHVFPPDHMPAGTNKSNNDIMLTCFEVALREAVTQAMSRLQPARLGFGSGVSRVSVNRDMPGKQGWWLQANDACYSDPYLGVVRIDTLQGEPLAILMNYAVQSSVTEDVQLAGGKKLISADLAGAASRQVESHFGAKTVALFLVGAAGDQIPTLQGNRHIIDDDGSAQRIDLHEEAFPLLTLLAERLGGDVVRVTESITQTEKPLLNIRRISISVPSLHFTPENAAKGPVTAFQYQPAGEIDVPIMLMSLGNIAWVGMQPELAASVGAFIRQHSPFAMTLITTMLDGGAKYMPDSTSYDRFTYEARSSPFAKGAAEQLASAIIIQLKDIKLKNGSVSS